MATISYNPPQPSGLSKDSVENFATSVAKQLGFGVGGDLNDVISKLGGRVRAQELWEIADSSSGSIRIDSDNSFEVVVALHTGPARDRFTIAHELGHYVLHYLWPLNQKKEVGPIEAKRYGTGRVEWEANWFAASFLMPEGEFRRIHAEVNGSVAALADRFKVSIEAAKVRAKSLGLGA